MVAKRYIAAPNPDPESIEFWDAAQKGVFLLPRCTDCQKYYWYPRSHCPHCFGRNIEWLENRGRGRIYSFTIMRRAEPPYCIAYVELDDGPRVLTNIIIDNLDAVRIGQRVEVVFVPATDHPQQKIPFFRPVKATSPNG